MRGRSRRCPGPVQPRFFPQTPHSLPGFAAEICGGSRAAGKGCSAEGGLVLRYYSFVLFLFLFIFLRG